MHRQTRLQYPTPQKQSLASVRLTVCLKYRGFCESWGYWLIWFTTIAPLWGSYTVVFPLFAVPLSVFRHACIFMHPSSLLSSSLLSSTLFSPLSCPLFSLLSSLLPNGVCLWSALVKHLSVEMLQTIHQANANHAIKRHVVWLLQQARTKTHQRNMSDGYYMVRKLYLHMGSCRGSRWLSAGGLWADSLQVPL